MKVGIQECEESLQFLPRGSWKCVVIDTLLNISSPSSRCEELSNEQLGYQTPCMRAYAGWMWPTVPSRALTNITLVKLEKTKLVLPLWSVHCIIHNR